MLVVSTAGVCDGGGGQGRQGAGVGSVGGGGGGSGSDFLEARGFARKGELQG